jgi:energy-coupling factor transporter ATP-binding protein EcfA2
MHIGTGKTTLLNVLSSFIPDDERIVTIEDAVELQLQQEHIVRLESRPRAEAPTGHPAGAARHPRPAHRRGRGRSRLRGRLQQTARNSRGPLPEELIRTPAGHPGGPARRVASLALGVRTQVQDLQRFVRAIAQADEHGVSIARVLSTQAQEMRIKRRQRAAERPCRSRSR